MEDENVEKKIATIRDWLSTQGHLPQGLEDRLLRRFLHSCYYDIEKTKSCIELFFTIRTSLPELIKKRDPASKDIQKYIEIVNLACIKLSGNRNLWIWQLNDPGMEKFDYVQDARLFFLAGDTWLLENDFMEESDIALMDVKDVSMKFIKKFNVSIARKISKYQEDAMPIRLKQIHVINAPSIIDKIYGLMRPFMKQEQADKIKFHKPNSDTLYKYISKEELPADYGGNAPKLSELMGDVVQEMMKHRDFFLNDNAWTIDESKRPKNSKNKNGSNIGSFRSLAID